MPRAATYLFDEVTAFVPHPDLRGVWIKTHACVATTACQFCNVSAGVPCRGKHGFTAATHAVRRRDHQAHIVSRDGPRVVIRTVVINR